MRAPPPGRTPASHAGGQGAGRTVYDITTLPGVTPAELGAGRTRCWRGSAKDC